MEYEIIRYDTLTATLERSLTTTLERRKFRELSRPNLRALKNNTLKSAAYKNTTVRFQNIRHFSAATLNKESQFDKLNNYEL